jgi:hypothetical protein
MPSKQAENASSPPDPHQFHAIALELSLVLIMGTSELALVLFLVQLYEGKCSTHKTPWIIYVRQEDKLSKEDKVDPHPRAHKVSTQR